jgi:hypothetical protein
MKAATIHQTQPVAMQRRCCLLPLLKEVSERCAVEFVLQNGFQGFLFSFLRRLLTSENADLVS